MHLYIISVFLYVHIYILSLFLCCLTYLSIFLYIFFYLCLSICLQSRKRKEAEDESILETRIQAAVEAALEKIRYTTKKARVEDLSSSNSLSDTDVCDDDDDNEEEGSPFKWPKRFSFEDHNKALIFSDVIKANKDFWYYQIFNYRITNKRTSSSQCNWVPVFDSDPFKTGFASFCKDAKATVDCRDQIIAKCADILKLSLYKDKTHGFVHDSLSLTYKTKCL